MSVTPRCIGLEFVATRPAGARSGNSKLLPDLYLVRILEDVAIGFEDLRIEIRVAVVFLRDLRQRVALLHHIVLRVRVVGAGGRGFAFFFHWSTSMSCKSGVKQTTPIVMEVR